MSVSDVLVGTDHTISSLTALLDERFTALMHGEASETLNLEDLRTLVSVAARLYAFAVDESDEQPVPINESVSPTEVVALASALLHARDLNPFDLAAWHARGPFPKGENR